MLYFYLPFQLLSRGDDVESKDGVSHSLDCCHVLEPPVFLGLCVINYLMDSVRCSARRVSFFPFYK